MLGLKIKILVQLAKLNWNISPKIYLQNASILFPLYMPGIKILLRYMFRKFIDAYSSKCFYNR